MVAIFFLLCYDKARGGEHMRKRWFVLVMAVLSLSISVPFAAAADEPVTIIVDGTELPIKGLIRDSRTLVPVREVTEAMGAEVTWVSETQQVVVWRNIPRCYDAGGGHYPIIGQDHYEVMFQIGNKTMTYTDPQVTDAVYTLDVPAQLINSKTMIPLRAACEFMAATVEWDGATSTATVTSRSMNLATQSEYEDWEADQAEQDAIGEVTDKPLDSYDIYVTPAGCKTPVNVSKWVGPAYGFDYKLVFVSNPNEAGGYFSATGFLTGTPGPSIYDVPDFPQGFAESDKTGTYSGIEMMSLEGNLWFSKADLQRLGLL